MLSYDTFAGFLVHGDVAQLVRACGSYPQGPGFKSLRRYQAYPRAGYHGDSMVAGFFVGHFFIRPGQTLY